MKYWLKNNSFLDTQYDYMVSLGHRCCVGQGMHYMRKSSFPFDWQITDIDGLVPLFKSELKDIYPEGEGITWVHEIHYPPAYPDGPEGGVDVEKTIETYSRRAQRLVKLLKDNNRKLLFIRSKYTWYWYENDYCLQKDMHSVNYDLYHLIELSKIFKNQYKNNNFHILYVYQDTRNWKPLKYTDGICGYDEFNLPNDEISVDLAQNKLVYIEQDGFKEHNITPVIVYPGIHRLEGNRYLTEIFRDLKLTNTQDFTLPYGFA
jgi:hypothetical protein